MPGAAAQSRLATTYSARIGPSARAGVNAMLGTVERARVGELLAALFAETVAPYSPYDLDVGSMLGDLALCFAEVRRWLDFWTRTFGVAAANWTFAAVATGPHTLCGASSR